MTSNHTETVSPAVISASHRAHILIYASYLLPLDARTADAVLMMAAPLLEWAGQATGKDDLRARMDAMSQAHRDGHPLRTRTPQEFLSDARAYHGFIAQG